MTSQQYPALGPPPKAPRKRMGLLLMLPLLFSMVALCLCARAWRESLPIESVRIVGAKSLAGNAVIMLAGIPPKSAMYSLDLMNVRQHMMSEPLLKDVRLNREFPGILEIAVTEREPIAALNCGKMLYVDAEGVVLPYIDGDRKLDLPLIIGIDGIQTERVGKPILNKELFFALEIVEQAQLLDSSIYHMISELDMKKGGDIQINSVDGGVPVILGRQDIPRKLLLFQAFWTNFVNSDDVRKLQYVDLRFDDQVVVRRVQGPEPQSKKVTL